MKKTLICLGLLFVMALSFTACGKPDYIEPDAGEKSQVDYVEADAGEKGQVDYVEPGSGEINYYKTDALIKSVEELDELRKSAQLRETAFASYDSEYFKDNYLIVIFRVAASGSYRYTVKSVESEGNTVNVTLQLWQPAIGTCDIREWIIPIECKKGNFSELNVVTEAKYQQRKADGTGFFIGFTHEATIETIYRDYTPADFPELDFEFTIEEMFTSGRDEVRQTLSEGSTDKGKQEYAQRFSRMFEINLTEKSEENVMRAAELLTQRKEISYVEPFYEYFFEMD